MTIFLIEITMPINVSEMQQCRREELRYDGIFEGKPSPPPLATLAIARLRVQGLETYEVDRELCLQRNERNEKCISAYSTCADNQNKSFRD